MARAQNKETGPVNCSQQPPTHYHLDGVSSSQTALIHCLSITLMCHLPPRSPTNPHRSETCIKGHRSSTCRHTDRPLFEIKKKGRPVTQCDHCRQLRKTKQVHVKCICVSPNIKKEPSSATGTKKGHTKMPDCATFPQGLPKALGASVAESVSLNGGMQLLLGALWNLGKNKTTIKSAPRQHRKKGEPPAFDTSECPASAEPTPAPAPAPVHVVAPTQTQAPSHILARLAEYRPVLPRPTPTLHPHPHTHTHTHTHSHRSRSNSEASHHDPSSSTAHGHSLNRRAHEFSPYGRAWDASHEHEFFEKGQKLDLETSTSFGATPTPAPTPATATFPTTDAEAQMFREAFEALSNPSASANWLPPENGSGFPPAARGAVAAVASTCGCGQRCRCPGCSQHPQPSRAHNHNHNHNHAHHTAPPSSAPAPASAPPSSAGSVSAYACTDPARCSSCIDCAIMSLPPADTALSIPVPVPPMYDQVGAEAIDEWLRQVAGAPPGSVPLDLDLDLDFEGIDMGMGMDMELGLAQTQTQAQTRNRSRSRSNSRTRTSTCDRTRSRSRSGSGSALPHPHAHPHLPQAHAHWEYLPPLIEPQPTDDAFGYAVKPCCGVLCKCDPETCECDIDDKAGYDCRREMLLPTFGVGEGAGAGGDIKGEGQGARRCCAGVEGGRDANGSGANGSGAHAYEYDHEHMALPPRSRSVNDVYFDEVALEVDMDMDMDVDVGFFGGYTGAGIQNQNQNQAQPTTTTTRSRSSSTSTSTSSSREHSHPPPPPPAAHIDIPPSHAHGHAHTHSHPHLMQNPYVSAPPPQAQAQAQQAFGVQVQDYMYPTPWAPGRVVRGPYYAGRGMVSVSSPNLGMQLQAEIAGLVGGGHGIAHGHGHGEGEGSRGSSPGSVQGAGAVAGAVAVGKGYAGRYDDS
ncbi:hypothetical protein H0H92_014779 [Tricholoma furcatifolium]|nr:hypothetical protein H0H92_014779 [Tricholoma furcatifolium]